MNGAESLVHTLINSGINICFTNPGTSELHTVAAMDRIPGIRMVLGLFEGVCTGAADGYGRMRNDPAAVLLHLGPGLGNGIANLHNARKANTPIVNIVGDHATYHLKYDAPLTADILSLAGPVSAWVHKVSTSAEVGRATSQAISAAVAAPGGVATLILPADCAWNEEGAPAKGSIAAKPNPVDEAAIRRIAQVLRSKEPTTFFATGEALMDKGLDLLARIQKATNSQVYAQTFNRRMQRGAGRFPIQRLPYAGYAAQKALAKSAHLILVGTKAPASFFAYPNSESLMAPPDCRIHTLATADQDIIEALNLLAQEINAPRNGWEPPPLIQPSLPDGALTPEKIWSCVAALMPPESIIVNESITSSQGEEKWMPHAPAHDWLDLTGGAIGIGLPLATGAALACPDRKVIALQADGSAMYTLQALWTQAREHLDVITIILNNRRYAILQNELKRVGADSSGPNALAVLDIGHPDLDWVKMANAMGVAADRAENSSALAQQISDALPQSGPRLIEACLF